MFNESITDLKDDGFDLDKIDNMYQFAKKRHDATGAIRKHSGDPYIVHPEGVSELVAVYGGTEDEINAALAHDLVEDAGVTVDEIESKFGPNVAQIVSEITNDRSEIARIGKEAYINKELLELSKPALFVKLGDMLYNMLDYPKPEQADRMMKNIEWLLDHRELDDREHEMIQSCCYAYAKQKRQ